MSYYENFIKNYNLNLIYSVFSNIGQTSLSHIYFNIYMKFIVLEEVF